MESLEKAAMNKSNERKMPALSPGVWSTDDYIRRWAKSQGMHGECVVPLQSLHDEWCAKINFDQDGHPVKRIAASVPSHFTAQGSKKESPDRTGNEREFQATATSETLA